MLAEARTEGELRVDPCPRGLGGKRRGGRSFIYAPNASFSRVGKEGAGRCRKGAVLLSLWLLGDVQRTEMRVPALWDSVKRMKAVSSSSMAISGWLYSRALQHSCRVC